MIEQLPVQPGDQTAPATIHDIRQRITQAVDATPGSPFERLRTWLQMPADATFKRALDSDCRVRANDVAVRLSTGGQGAYTPSSLALALNIQAKWDAIDTRLNRGQAVVIEGASAHVCGGRSYFIDQENGLGFHVIVFLAVGLGADGRRFYLGFDPDVSATAASRAAWNELIPVDAKVQDLHDAAESVRIIKAMILGGSPDGFGPLVRKYYVETDKPFPKIVHA